MYRKPISIGYLDGISHLIVQVEKLGIKNFNDLVELAFADNIRLRGTWELVINYSIEYNWIILGPDEDIKLGDGLKFPSSIRDFILLQRQLLWLYIKKEKPTWLRYAKNGLDGVKPHITDDDERQVFRQLGLMPNSENNDIEYLILKGYSSFFSSLLHSDLHILKNERNRKNLTSLKYLFAFSIRPSDYKCFQQSFCL